MSRKVTATCRILGGLPVEIDATIYPPEPDVGISHEQVEITSIRFEGRGRKQGAEISDSMKARLTDKDREAMDFAAVEQLEDLCCDPY